MEKLKAIIKREYLTRVRSKGFIIGTILSPLADDEEGRHGDPSLLFSSGVRRGQTTTRSWRSIRAGTGAYSRAWLWR